ncbi:MAG: signal peptide peptidase SppA [Oscillospiraceae bacterium]
MDNHFTEPLPPKTPLPQEAATEPVSAAEPVKKGKRRRARPIEVVLAALALAVVLFLGMLSVSLLALAGGVNALFATSGPSTNPPANTFSVISVVGTIQNSSGGALGINEPSYKHSATLAYIKQLAEDEGNKGILLYMNTGGGGVYESDEVYRALEAYKEKTGRPIWAYMAATCASGGYYICMAAEHIAANYNNTTGSIGVYIALTDTSGLYEKFGIKTVLIRSGANKGVGVSGVEITPEQQAVYQSMVDESYERFVALVAKGRGMEESRVRTLADGRPYTGSQALENGLVDELTDWDTAQQAFKDFTGADAFTPNFSQSTLLGSLIGGLADTLPKNESETLLDAADALPQGVPLAWAPGLGWPLPEAE